MRTMEGKPALARDGVLPVAEADAGHALVASFLGWTLDAFDFFVLIFVLPAVAADFHRSIPDVTLAITATLAMRPVGAIIFGWLADRYGRRRPLMANVLFYSAVEMASGFAPGFGSFVALRALYGIGMGGEWGIGAALAMEAAPTTRRGLLSGLLQEGYSAGYLLAAAAYFVVFPRLGWRPMFFIGAAPALLVLLYIRARVPESRTWERLRPGHAAIWHALRANFRRFLYVVALMTLMGLIAHGTQDLYPTFLERGRGLPPHTVAVIAVLYNVGAILGGLAVGHLSDRLGRRRAMVWATLLAAALVPAWLYPGSLLWLAAGAFAIQFMVQGAWGVVPAHLAELSPVEARGLFTGLAYQLGAMLAGNAAFIEAELARRLGYAAALAAVALTVLVASAAVILLGPERTGGRLDADSTSPSAPFSRQDKPYPAH